jgi:hypothetical protein
VSPPDIEVAAKDLLDYNTETTMETQRNCHGTRNARSAEKLAKNASEITIICTPNNMQIATVLT